MKAIFGPDLPGIGKVEMNQFMLLKVYPPHPLEINFEK